MVRRRILLKKGGRGGVANGGKPGSNDLVKLALCIVMRTGLTARQQQPNFAGTVHTGKGEMATWGRVDLGGEGEGISWEGSHIPHWVRNDTKDSTTIRGLLLGEKEGEGQRGGEELNVFQERRESDPGMTETSYQGKVQSNEVREQKGKVHKSLVTSAGRRNQPVELLAVGGRPV